MPYTNWTDDLDAVAAVHAFLPARALRELIFNLRGIRFAYETERQRAQLMLAEFTTLPAPFASDQRFPEDLGRAVVDIDADDWPQIFGQLNGALQYKTPDVAQTNKDLADVGASYNTSQTSNRGPKLAEPAPDDGSKSITSMSERNRLEKATLQWSHAVTLANEAIGRTTLTRKTFERKYGLAWG